jgi:hypothetical protein
MFSLRAMDAGKLAEARAVGHSLPEPHSALFQPVPEPTLRGRHCHVVVGDCPAAKK